MTNKSVVFIHTDGDAFSCRSRGIYEAANYLIVNCHDKMLRS